MNPKEASMRSDATTDPSESLKQCTGSDSVCYCYSQNRIQRQPSVGLRGGKYKTHSLRQRLSARTVIADGPDPCWNIQGCKVGNNGYGQIKADSPSRKMLYAHRAAWMLENGPIPDGMVVLHRCDNPRCVNPSHLSLGTQADNIADSHGKGRFTAWHQSGVRLDGRVSRRYARRVSQLSQVGERAVVALAPTLNLSDSVLQLGGRHGDGHKHLVHGRTIAHEPSVRQLHSVKQGIS